MKDPVDLGRFEGIGTLAKVDSAREAFVKFTSVFSTGLGILTISGGIWFIIQIGAGAFQWLSSAGEKDALSKAQKKISNAIFGLFVIVFAYALISIVGKIFGLDILSPFNSLFGTKSGVIPTPNCGPGQEC